MWGDKMLNNMVLIGILNTCEPEAIIPAILAHNNPNNVYLGVLHLPPSFYPLITPEVYEAILTVDRFIPGWETWSREQAILKTLADMGD